MRSCKKCGVDISERWISAKYCIRCADIQKKDWQKNNTRSEYLAQYRKAKQKSKPIDRPIIKKCKTCDYFNMTDKMCQYMLFTGMRRNSEPENCDKWEKRKKTKKKSLAEW